MKVRKIPVACNMCGYSSVKPRVQIFESNGKKMEEIKWVCPRCSRVTKRATQEADGK